MAAAKHGINLGFARVAVVTLMPTSSPNSLCSQFGPIKAAAKTKAKEGRLQMLHKVHFRRRNCCRSNEQALVLLRRRSKNALSLALSNLTVDSYSCQRAFTEVLSTEIQKSEGEIIAMKGALPE